MVFRPRNDYLQIRVVRFARFANRHHLLCSLIFLALIFSCYSRVMPFPTNVLAQVELPDKKFLFAEDKKKKDDRDKKRDDSTRKAKSSSTSNLKGLPFDVDAPTLKFDQANNAISGEGGVRITWGDTLFEAEKGNLNLNTNLADLSGDVYFSDPLTSFSADAAKLDLSNSTGELTNANIEIEDGDYILAAEKARKVGEEDYEMENGTLTSCECPSGTDSAPWSLFGRNTKVTKEGYGQVWNGFLRVHDVPVLYCPYLIFPAKAKRQSGLLPGSFGNSGENGFSLELPFFWAIDDSTDATITPIVDTKTRWGVDVEGRKIFSRRNRLQFGVTYLNENWRDGELQGTDVSDLANPLIGVNRFGGYLNQSWSSDVADEPVQFLLDGNYVTDDLFLREYEKEEIGPSNSRYVTSNAVFRVGLFDNYNAELSSEFNQSLIESDRLVLQRVPEFNLEGIHRFRPLGSSPYGLKLVLNNQVDATNFVRRSFYDQTLQDYVHSYDGFRGGFYERLNMPFHFQNYFDADLSTGLRGTVYSLNDTDEITSTAMPDIDLTTGKVKTLEKTSDRLLPEFGTRVRTTVERVFDVDDGSFLKRFLELGAVGREGTLARLRHTVTPEVRYKAVAAVDQSDNPQFDSEDQLEQKSVVTYALTQRLFGRYDRTESSLVGVEETAPDVEEIEPLREDTPFFLDDADAVPVGTAADTTETLTRKGDIRELANLKLSQTFDVLEYNNDRDEELGAFSDLAADLALLPNEYLRLRGRSNLNVENLNFSSYSLESQLLSKRGDQLRARFTVTDNVDDPVRQVETSLELKLTERLKLGYYARYDDITGQFIENRGGVRISSSCNKCWMLDVGLIDKTNPDETKFLVTVTLAGLGEFGNTFLTNNRRQNNQAN